MTAVFSHGRLRLYLLKLLAEGPKHGYELIRLLENRFLGLYAPSAGTIYPRLQRMQAEGLVTRTQAGGRKVYEITDAGRAELDRRAAEVTQLESEIHASVADLATLATTIQEGVQGSVRDLKRELRDATRSARSGGPAPAGGGPHGTRPGNRPGPTRGSTGAPEPPADAPETPGGGYGRPGGARASAAGGASGATLEYLAAELAAEVRWLTRRAGASEDDLRAAASALTAALAALRRLVGG